MSSSKTEPSDDRVFRIQVCRSSNYAEMQDHPGMPGSHLQKFKILGPYIDSKIHQQEIGKKLQQIISSHHVESFEPLEHSSPAHEDMLKDADFGIAFERLKAREFEFKNEPDGWIEARLFTEHNEAVADKMRKAEEKKQPLDLYEVVYRPLSDTTRIFRYDDSGREVERSYEEAHNFRDGWTHWSWQDGASGSFRTHLTDKAARDDIEEKAVEAIKILKRKPWKGTSEIEEEEQQRFDKYMKEVEGATEEKFPE